MGTCYSLISSIFALLAPPIASINNKRYFLHSFTTWTIYTSSLLESFVSYTPLSLVLSLFCGWRYFECRALISLVDPFHFLAFLAHDILDRARSFTTYWLTGRVIGRGCLGEPLEVIGYDNMQRFSMSKRNKEERRKRKKD